jgi:Glycoside-hydrolase family GH114
VFGWSLDVAHPTRNLSGLSTTRDPKTFSEILSPLRPSLSNMLYWLLLLVCAYASTSFGGEVAFSVGQKWQIILSNPPIVTSNTKVVPQDALVWDIDTVDADAGDISVLHAQGKIVICYFSAGTYEYWRPDADQFKPADKGASLAPQWPDENWLNIKSANVRTIMTARIKLAASKGCDAVDPDNVGTRLTLSYNLPLSSTSKHAFKKSRHISNYLCRWLRMEPSSISSAYARNPSRKIVSLQGDILALCRRKSKHTNESASADTY